MKTLKERIAIEQACLDGAEIESQLVSTLDDRRWQYKLMPVDRNTVVFSWDEIDYRIKQEPMTFWVNVYSGGSSYMHSSEERAINCREGCSRSKTIKVREVTDEE